MLIRLPFTCFHALKLQQLPSRVQKFDLLTFQSLDHQCNGWADSTWTSWPVDPLTEGLLTVSCAVYEDFWRLRQGVKAMCSHAHGDLLQPSAASAAHQWTLMRWATQKKHRRVYNCHIFVFTWNVLLSWGIDVTPTVLFWCLRQQHSNWLHDPCCPHVSAPIHVGSRHSLGPVSLYFFWVKTL